MHVDSRCNSSHAQKTAPSSGVLLPGLKKCTRDWELELSTGIDTLYARCVSGVMLIDACLVKIPEVMIPPSVSCGRKAIQELMLINHGDSGPIGTYSHFAYLREELTHLISRNTEVVQQYPEESIPSPLPIAKLFFNLSKNGGDGMKTQIVTALAGVK